ncbi:acyl carrier protein [Calditrichota bacterium LG25]
MKKAGIYKMTDIQLKLKKIISEVTGLDGSIENDVTFYDLGLDSLDIVEIVIAVEEEFNIEIPDEDVEQLKCFGDAVKYLESKLKISNNKQPSKNAPPKSFNPIKQEKIKTSSTSTFKPKIKVSSEILINAAQPNLYRINAFRILGLPIDATTREISHQVEKIKIMGKYGNTKISTSGPFPLEPPPDSDDIREALQRLRDPERRFIDEFFWFWPHINGQSKRDQALLALAKYDIKTAKSIWINYEAMSSEANVSMHNLAVLAHLLALDLEYKGSLKVLNEKEAKMRDYFWTESFKRWKILLTYEGFWKRLEVRIRDFDDPRLTIETLTRIRETLPIALIFINAKLAVIAAENRNKKEAKRHLKIIENSGFDNNVIEVALLQAVTPIRERIKTICQYINKERTENPEQSNKLAQKVMEQTKNLLFTLDLVLTKNNPIREGAHDEVALTALDSIISYGNKTSDWERCFKLIKEVQKIVQSESARSRVQSNYDIIKENYEYNLENNICFFCKENPAEDLCAIKKEMWGDEERYGPKVYWRHITIRVPRCRRCEKVHKKITTFSWVGGIIFGFLILWFGGNIIHIGINATIGATMGYFLAKWTSPENVKPKSHFSNFSTIKELKKRGWKYGSGPSDVAS